MDRIEFIVEKIPGVNAETQDATKPTKISVVVRCPNHDKNLRLDALDPFAWALKKLRASGREKALRNHKGKERDVRLGFYPEPDWGIGYFVTSGGDGTINLHGEVDELEVIELLRQQPPLFKYTMKGYVRV